MRREHLVDEAEILVFGQGVQDRSQTHNLGVDRCHQSAILPGGDLHTLVASLLCVQQGEVGQGGEDIIPQLVQALEHILLVQKHFAAHLDEETAFGDHTRTTLWRYTRPLPVTSAGCSGRN